MALAADFLGELNDHTSFRRSVCRLHLTVSTSLPQQRMRGVASVLSTVFRKTISPIKCISLGALLFHFRDSGGLDPDRSEVLQKSALHEN